MRILVTGFTTNPGGVENSIMNYYRRIQDLDSGIVFDFLGTTKHPAHEQEIKTRGGMIYKIPSPSHIDAYKKICDFFRLKARNYDIIWVNKCDLFNIDYLKAAKKYGIRVRIIHSHNSYNMYSGIRKLLVAAGHSVNRRRIDYYATDYWACSDLAANWMFPGRILFEGKVRCVPNAIHISDFIFDESVHNSVRESLQIKDETELVIGYVGRLTKQKNPVFALEVFAHICECKKAQLLVVGEGDMLEEVIKYAEQLPCSESVRFLGQRSDVSRLMQAIDCLILPSLFEGLPLVAVEAQATGIPVFAASEAISPQTDLTGRVHFLPLSDGAEKWAEYIAVADCTRYQAIDSIREKGFDIDTAAERLLESFYSKIT